MNKKFYRTSLDVSIQKSESDSFTKAIGNYAKADSGMFGDLRGIIEKQPDLLYGLSILVSEGANANDDGFLREQLIDIFKTPRHKFVDYEHDVDATSVYKNPSRYKVVGHIYDSVLSVQDTGELIDDSFVVKEDGKWFAADSGFRDKALDIVVAWVIYKFQYPELAQLVEDKFENNDNKAFGVSMEVLFTDYKYRVGDFDAGESFDFNATSIGCIEAKYGDPLFNKLEAAWKKRQKYDGKKITRILGGDMFFSGMAITGNRANKRSINLSIASIAKNFSEHEQEKEQDDLVNIIKAVSNKDANKDLGACELIDGVPVCGCTKASIEEKIDLLVSNIEDFVGSFSSVLGVGALSASTEDEEDDYDTYMKDAKDNLDKAQEKLHLLYENNLDKDMDRETMMDFLDEIQQLVTNATISAEKLEKFKN